LKADVAVYGGFTPGMYQRAQRDWRTHETVLRGGGPVVTGAQGARLDGFTITGGSAESGAGVYVAGCAMTLENCVVTGNVATVAGGGVYLSGSTSVIARCRIEYNNSAIWGGGVYVSYCVPGPVIRNCVFLRNRLDGGNDGGAIYVEESALEIRNCTFFQNYAKRQGGALQIFANDEATPGVVMKNAILWGDSVGMAGNGDEVCVQKWGKLYWSYSDVAGGSAAMYHRGGGEDFPGAGNLDLNPLFADTDTGDVHLKSEAGRWTPDGTVFDDETSPCVDAGDPADPCDEEGQSEPCSIDMGAYGGTREAGGSGAFIAPGVILIVR
jgi:hypothetical protein